MSFPSNIVDSLGAPFEAYGETLFFQKLFATLQERLCDDFHRFTFVLHRRGYRESAGNPIRLDPGRPARVLIVLADERELFPVEEFQSYKVIFRAYGNPDPALCQAFPVGYHNAAGSADIVDFDQRKISVFFSGYMNRNRLDLYKQFRSVWWLPKRNLKNRYVKEIARRASERMTKERNFPNAIQDAQITFTESFGKGLPPDEYAKTLANSRIALCPPGFVSHETIRHWEAMRLGCVVISAPLPKNRFYEGSPIIQLEDWSELKPLLAGLLEDPARLRGLHEATVDWWNSRCSEVAVADYMAAIIR